MMRAFWLAFLLGIFRCVGAASALEIYQCSVNKRPQEFIAQTVVFAYEPGAKTALVSDDVTQNFLRKPVEARLRDRGNKLSLNWRIKGAKTASNIPLPVITYSANFNRKTQVIRMNAAATGYGVDFSESGKCRLLPDSERSKITALLNNPQVRKQVEKANAKVYTYNCKITRKNKFEDVTPDTLKIVLKDRDVIISDDIMAKLGKSDIAAKVDRVVDSDLLFGWALKNIPRAMKPDTETKFYGDTVNYRARLNLKNGKFAMEGNFVTRVSSANTGKQMTGTGRCKLQKP